MVNIKYNIKLGARNQAATTRKSILSKQGNRVFYREQLDNHKGQRDRALEFIPGKSRWWKGRFQWQTSEKSAIHGHGYQGHGTQGEVL